jgi:hypothetical protein
MCGKKISAPKSTKGKFKHDPGPRLSTNRDTPLFGLGYLDSVFSLDACNKDEKAAFADTLAKLSKLTWGEINNSGRHKNGCEIITQDQIRASMPPHITPEINLLAFRFCAKAPMVGYRDGRVFYVIWLDRAFKLYNH